MYLTTLTNEERGFLMKAVRHLFTAAALCAVAVGLTVTSASAGPPEKGDVCHDGDNGWEVIRIAEPAFEAHVEHGDALPGEAVPGHSNLVFDNECVPFDPEPAVFAATMIGVPGCSLRFPGYWGAFFDLHVTSSEVGLGWRVVEPWFDLLKPTPDEFIPVTQIRKIEFPADPRDGLGMLLIGAGGSISVHGGTVEFSNGETATFEAATVNDPGPEPCNFGP